MSAGTYTTEDGCLLAYDDVGEGMPVVWQHGLGADRRQPAEVFPANLNIRRITLECRGHGASHMGDPERLTIAQFADDVVALLEHLHIEKAVFGGISLGAAIGMRIAATLPSGVAGLILARPAWVDAPAPVTMQPYLLVADLLRGFGPEEGLRRFNGSDKLAAVAKVSPDNAASLCGFFAAADPERTIELLSRIPKDGPGLSRHEIAAITAPTLIIANAEDYVHPLQYASQLKDLIPGATMQVITSKTVDKSRYQAEFRMALADFLQKQAAP